MRKTIRLKPYAVPPRRASCTWLAKPIMASFALVTIVGIVTLPFSDPDPTHRHLAALYSASEGGDRINQKAMIRYLETNGAEKIWAWNSSTSRKSFKQMTLEELEDEKPGHAFIKPWRGETSFQKPQGPTYSFFQRPTEEQKHTLKRFQLEIHNAPTITHKTCFYRFHSDGTMDNTFNNRPDGTITFGEIAESHKSKVENFNLLLSKTGVSPKKHAFLIERENRGRLNLKAIAVADEGQTYMLQFDSMNYVQCERLDRFNGKGLTKFFDVMSIGTSGFERDEVERKLATLTRIELLRLRPFIQEEKMQKKGTPSYVKPEQKTLTVILLTLRPEITLEPRYLMVKVDAGTHPTKHAANRKKNDALVKKITDQLEKLRWIRPDLKKFTKKIGTEGFQWTEEDFTVAQTEWYTWKKSTSPGRYHSIYVEGGRSIRYDKQKFFSDYMTKEVLPSTIWNPTKPNMGTMGSKASNNLDKRYCTTCKTYYPYQLGETRECHGKECHGIETRHPYHVYNLITGKDKNDDTKYREVWGDGDDSVLKKTRGQMHASWGHQLFTGELEKVAKACKFAV